MFTHLSPKHQLGLAAIGAVTLFGVSFIGGQYARRPPEITVTQQTPATVTVPEPKPVAATRVAAPEPSEVVVHVAGAVKTPKVVRLSAGARVEDAIKAAGGAKADADLEKSVNLAEKLVDGEKIYIHSTKEADLPIVESSEPSGSTPPSAAKGIPAAGASGEVVHLNTATAADLDTLPGVGPATAQKILDYRQEHGGFGSVEEIMAVKGIGPKKYEAMKRRLKL